MKITADTVKTLREQSGAGVMECRNVLAEADGDIQKAVEILKGRCLYKAEKKKERATTQGLVEAYIHAGGRIGALVELSCETDFVAKSKDFQILSHELCLQIAAMGDEAPLLEQPWVKDQSKTVNDLLEEYIAKIGENIAVKKFTRYEI